MSSCKYLLSLVLSLPSAALGRQGSENLQGGEGMGGGLQRPPTTPIPQPEFLAAPGKTTADILFPGLVSLHWKVESIVK